MSFTRNQRLWCLDKAGHQSEMRHYSENKGWHHWERRPEDALHVHHIDPQGNGGGDNPFNAIVLYEREHVGRMGRGQYVDPERVFVVHADMLDAFKSYDGTNSSFNAVFAARRELTASGEPYWNTDHDIEMTETAFENTCRFLALGNEWPGKGERCKKMPVEMPDGSVLELWKHY